jgi:hypothetical protein
MACWCPVFPSDGHRCTQTPKYYLGCVSPDIRDPPPKYGRLATQARHQIVNHKYTSICISDYSTQANRAEVYGSNRTVYLLFPEPGIV